MSLPTCLTLRTVKGSTLSWAELDNNFICLNNLISAKAGTGGNRWYIPSGETVSVTSDYQYFFYGDILIEGTLDLAPNSQLVVLNGDILMSGGTITGTGSIYDIDLPTFDTKVTGMTYSGDVLTLYQNDGTSFSATVVTSTDITVTGGTYDPNTGVATFYNNVGGNFPVSGFLTGYTDINVSSLEYVGNTLVLNQTNNTSFSANTPMFSGGTVSGGTTFLNGLTANTISTNEITLSGTSLTSILDNTVKKYSQTLISPTAGRYTITHNLGTTDISVSLWLAFSNELTNAKILNRLPNSVDVEFSVSPSEDVLVLIMGTTVNSSGVAYIYSAVTVGPNQIAYGDATGLITSNSTFVRNPISGNIGIGTSTPTYKLDVSGTVRTTGIAAINNPPFSSPQFALEVKAIDNSIGGLRLWSNNETASVSMAYRGISSSSLFDIQTNSGQPLTLNASGNNVGVGTSTPTQKLHVVGDFKVDGTNPNSLYVGTDGNVGIGTNNPTTKLTISANTLSNDILNISNTQFPGIGTKIDRLGNLVVEGPSNTGYSEIAIINRGGFQSNLVVDSDNIGSSIALKRSNQNRYGIVANNVDTVDETLYVPFRTFLDSSHRILSRTGSTEVMYIDATVNNSKIGIGTTTPSSKLHLVGNNSSNGSYIRATQRTTGVGTISASQGTGPIYSAYTRIDGVGTYFSNDLTYGESITSSGFTLGIYQIINNTLMYTYLNTGATFSNQPYTLQGNSRFEVGNNYFNVGNGNLVAYDNGSSIFIGTSALSTNRYRGLSFGAEGGTFMYCDIANNNVQIPKRVYINGTSAGNTSYLSVGGDGTFSTKFIGLQSNGTIGSTMFVIGQQDSNYNTTMRFSHRPEQYGYYYYAYGVSQNNASSIGIGTDPTSTHRLTVNDGLKLLSTPFNETILDIKQATSVSIDSSMASSPLINAYSANTVYGLRTVLKGVNIGTNLNIGEKITASGVTLTITEKEVYDNSTIYATYDPLAQFTGYSYTLEGLPRFIVKNNGNVGIGTTTPTSTLDINGTNGYNQLRLRTSFTPTGSTDTRGNVGDIAWDDNNFYWKTSTQWLKVSGQTF